MKKRILLTGSNGLLGQKLVSHLAHHPKLELIATSRGPDRYPIQKGYTYVSADLLEPQQWEEIFETYKPAEIIHTAAITQVDVCENDKEMCDRVNVDALDFLCSLCEKHKVRMIYISTDFVFNGDDGPYRETDVPDPVNYYGLSKWKAEQCVQKLPHHVILRTILLYGVSPKMSRSNILLWAKKSLENGETVRVVNDQYRCPTLVEDLAIATLKASMYLVNGIYHICGDEWMRVADLVYRIADYWKLDRSLITEIHSGAIAAAAPRPMKTGFIIDKAKRDLDFQPRSLEEGFAIVDEQLKALKVES